MGRHFGDLIINAVIEMKNKGYTHREIGEKLGYEKEQIAELVKRHNKKTRLIQGGLAIRKKGRPRKDVKINDTDKIAAIKYELGRKDYEINRLKMQNELLRDFLCEVERG